MGALDDLFQRRPDLIDCGPAIEQVIGILATIFRQGGKLLVCGNGGSAADSEHIVGELMKGFRLPRPISPGARARLEAAWPAEGARLADGLQDALPAISLVSQTSLLTAFINDGDPHMLFAQQVHGYGRPGDALLALSTSGNARNVLNALKVARALGLRTLGFTGRLGGDMPVACDVLVCVPYDRTSDIQEAHLAIYHLVCAELEKEFFQL